MGHDGASYQAEKNRAALSPQPNPHLPGSAGHSSPKKPAGLHRDRTLLFTRWGYTAGRSLEKPFPLFESAVY